MKLEEIEKIDWRQDRDLYAVQQKLAGLAEREKKERVRTEELDQIIHDGEQSLVQAHASEMLGETSEESVEVIQRRLESARRETADLRATIAAVEIARTRLEQDVLIAKSAAKLKVADVLAPVYRKATETLRELLAKAAEVNQVLHAVHDQSIKCDLRSQAHTDPNIKPLGFPMALNVLGLRGGKPSPELEQWLDHVDRIFGAS